MKFHEIFRDMNDTVEQLCHKPDCLLVSLLVIKRTLRQCNRLDLRNPPFLPAKHNS